MAQRLTKKRISKGSAAVLFSTAVFFDLLSAIPWVGLLFVGIGYVVLGVWFKLKDVSPFEFTAKGWKKAVTAALDPVFGFFGLSIVPGITAWATTVIYDANQEDEEREKEAERKAKRLAKEIKKAQKQAIRARQQQAEQVTTSRGTAPLYEHRRQAALSSPSAREESRKIEQRALQYARNQPVSPVKYKKVA